MTLFDGWDAPPPVPPPSSGLSAGRRLTLRQRADIDRGRHPLTGLPLTGEPGATCGNCRFRERLGYRRRIYPKCTTDDGIYLTHGAGSDCRAWWPACTRHEWGDTRLSPDAARSGPQGGEP